MTKSLEQRNMSLLAIIRKQINYTTLPYRKKGHQLKPIQVLEMLLPTKENMMKLSSFTKKLLILIDPTNLHLMEWATHMMK